MHQNNINIWNPHSHAYLGIWGTMVAGPWNHKLVFQMRDLEKKQSLMKYWPTETILIDPLVMKPKPTHPNTHRNLLVIENHVEVLGCVPGPTSDEGDETATQGEGREGRQGHGEGDDQ